VFIISYAFVLLLTVDIKFVFKKVSILNPTSNISTYLRKSYIFRQHNYRDIVRREDYHQYFLKVDTRASLLVIPDDPSSILLSVPAVLHNIYSPRLL
jgi:hypothetical protein